MYCRARKKWEEFRRSRGKKRGKTGKCPYQVHIKNAVPEPGITGHGAIRKRDGGTIGEMGYRQGSEEAEPER